MAIANYTDLKATIASWLHRPDLTETIVDLVTLGEAHLNRVIRTSNILSISSLTLPINAIGVTNSSSRGPIQSLRIATYGELPQKPIDVVVNAAAANTGKTGRPTMWCSVGDATRFDINADIEYIYTATHHLRLMIATDATNWLLTNHPDAYLYASLAAAAPLLRDDPRVSLWISLRDRAVKEVNIYCQKGQETILQTGDVSAMTGGSSYDIRAG